jgi:hypothetical protein
MLLALGAISSAFDALQSLTSKKSSSPQATTGFSQTAATPFDTGASPAPSSGGSSQSGGLSPATMSALLAAQGQSSSSAAPTSQSDALKNLFSQLDADGDGKVSKSEFENALGAGGSNLAQADDVFNKLDKDGDGSVSLDEMSSALKGVGGHGHGHHHHVASSDGSGDSSGTSGSDSDPLLQALDATTSTAVTNSDGSTTTSLTYADGSKVTMTSAPTASASTAAASSYNIIEQMIQREAQAISASATSSLGNLSV